MAQRLQVRGGTQEQNDIFVGADRELTVDTTNWAIRIHDGTTPGGHVVSPGPAGAGVPDGGLEGQVLAKASNSWQDTEWVDLPDAPVTSVAGQTGDVELTVEDIGGLSAVALSGSYNDLADVPELMQEQADWAETNITLASYIKNKPFLVDKDYVDTAISTILGGADIDYDTLGELQNLIIALQDATDLDGGTY
jgi:hypothetical protein